MALTPVSIGRTGVLAAALLASVPALAQPAPGQLLEPVRPACISSPFGNRPAPGPHAIGFHNGIDLSAAAGAPVFAAAAGQVISIHRRGPGGLELAIAHRGPTGPFVTIYAHLGLIAPAFAQGKSNVAAGERIAVVGRSGVIYGTHLYFEMMIGGQPVDPAGYFPLVPCAGSRSASRTPTDTGPRPH